jgi:ABC-type antimicrobial peptide transport system permease subunit
VKRTLVAGALAIGIGVPVGWVAAMVSTPLLWKLEPILNMELAGHSGPADWVFYVVWPVVIPGLFAVFSTAPLQ